MNASTIMLFIAAALTLLSSLLGLIGYFTLGSDSNLKNTKILTLLNSLLSLGLALFIVGGFFLIFKYPSYNTLFLIVSGIWTILLCILSIVNVFKASAVKENFKASYITAVSSLFFLIISLGVVGTLFFFNLMTKKQPIKLEGELEAIRQVPSYREPESASKQLRGLGI